MGKLNKKEDDLKVEEYYGLGKEPVGEGEREGRRMKDGHDQSAKMHVWKCQS
jgi:hypothetical protein